MSSGDSEHRLLPYTIFRTTPEVRFYDITVPDSNCRDLVWHGPGAVSPPDVDGVQHYYIHDAQDDNLLVVQGSRSFTLINHSWATPMVEIELTPETGILHIPAGTLHRSVSGPEGSTVLNQAVREPGVEALSQFSPVSEAQYLSSFYGDIPQEQDDAIHHH